MTLKTSKSSVISSKNIRLVIKPRGSDSSILSPHLKSSPISLSSSSSSTSTSEETTESIASSSSSSSSSHCSKSSRIDDYGNNHSKVKLNLYHNKSLLRKEGGSGGSDGGDSVGVGNGNDGNIKNNKQLINDHDKNDNKKDSKTQNCENKIENDDDNRNSVKVKTNENYMKNKNNKNDKIYNIQLINSSLLMKNQLHNLNHSILFSKPHKSISRIGKEIPGKKFKKIIVSICVTYCRYPVVAKVAKSLGWKLVKENNLWNIFWTDSIQVIETFKDIKRFQRINHFPGMSEICRKDLLARNLNRMLKLFPEDFDIFPKTWCFPADLGEAVAYAKEHKMKTFILKPDQGAQGKGIWLTKNLKEIKPHERMICQVYVNRPLLIDGYKFDLRLYALVTSVDPLRIFVYNEGLVRFATNKYKEPTGQNTSNVFMHLTNYSVNKHSRTFCKDDEGGSKRKLSTFNRILMSEGYDIDLLWKRIDDIIVKTILSAWPILKHNYHACFPTHNIVQGCFEILGFDILIDSKLKPYILEVNHSPSFHTDEEVDKDVKESLLKDTFKILNISQIDKRKIMSDDRRRIQNRLLNKTKDLLPMDYENQNEQNNIVTDPIAQQIKWEETHLGGFRRIMPPTDDNPDKYERFNIVFNQSSIYSETAASKRREEAAKQLRREIMERENRLKQSITTTTNTTSSGTNHGATVNNTNSSACNSNKSKKSQKLMKKRKYEKILHAQKWLMGNFIVDSDERQRVLLLSQRDLLVRNYGIVEIILESFYRNQLLTESDYTKYVDAIEQIMKNHENQNHLDHKNYNNNCNNNNNNNNGPDMKKNIIENHFKKFNKKFYENFTMNNGGVGGVVGNDDDKNIITIKFIGP